MPFAVLDKQPLAERVQKLTGDMQHQRYVLPGRLSEGAQDMLKQLLQPDPKARIDIAGALAVYEVRAMAVYGRPSMAV
jgi:hypothetical protein